MTSHHIRTIALPAVLGLAGPYLWVTTSFWWTLFTSAALFRWMWVTFSLKGTLAYFVVAAIETIVLAALFGLALRIVAGISWWQPVIAFSVAFVLSLLTEAVWNGDTGLLVYIAPNVLALLVCTALVRAAFRTLQANDA